MDKFVTNPFDRSALTDSKLLAGRENEFKQIKFILRNAHNQPNRIKSIMICGDRGVGKTSMLNLIEGECSINNIIPIRLNLTESNSKNSNEFFWYLFSQALTTFFDLDLLGGRGGVIDSAIQKIIVADGVSDVANWIFKTPILRKNYLNNENVIFEFDQLVNDLKLLRNEITKINNDKYNPKTKFLFLVDESQNMYSNKKIIEELRFIVQNQELGYAFVFAGDSSYEKSQWDIVFGGSHRDFEIINLDYFDDVNSVKEYFRKSLESIGWSSKEIEDTLFYRFNHACSQIYNLTSGKPAWINEIGQKMFERCMRKESDMMRFDRNAQNDVKLILLNSGHIDNRKLEFVESLSAKYQKWLSKILASELSTLRQVYFYSKFVLHGDNYLSPDDFRQFCQSLVDSGILVFLQKSEEKNRIGFDSNKQVDILDIPYYTFGENTDSFKLWLQINSDGGFRFSLAPADYSFVTSITNDLSSEIGNAFVINSKFQEINLDDEFRLSKIIERINQDAFDVVDAPFRIIEMLYRFAKRIANSKNKQILFVKLTDNISKRVKIWNIYAINEQDRLIDFNENKYKIQRYREAVEKFNSAEINYTLEIFVDHLTEISLEKFQNLIVNSGDAKKRGIVISDKMEHLVNAYIKDHNVENSYNIASFFYKLYEEGHELGIHNLNNTAYVFIVKNELERAYQLLKEAKKIIFSERIEKEDYGTAALVLYNLGILNAKMSQFLEAKSEFENCLDYYNSYDFEDENAGALLVLEILDNELHINELTEDNDRGRMKCKVNLSNNIAVLEQVIRLSVEQGI